MEAASTAPQLPPTSPHLAILQQHCKPPLPLARTMHRAALLLPAAVIINDASSTVLEERIGGMRTSRQLDKADYMTYIVLLELLVGSKT